jgi:hypothetical protein
MRLRLANETQDLNTMSLVLIAPCMIVWTKVLLNML